MPGNIDLTKQKGYVDESGNVRTVYSTSVGIDGYEVLLPLVTPEGVLMNTREAVDRYRETGKHLGKFKTRQEATAYAEWLHEQEAKRINKDE